MDGEGLKAFRLRMKMTQDEIADALGVANNTIARWERGERRIEHPQMLRLALERLEQNNA